MTDAEWLASTTKPALMFRRVMADLSARKLQLLACAQSRLLPVEALEDWAREALDLAERFAEGDLPAAEYRQAAERVRAACDDLEMRSAVHGDVPEEVISAATTVLCATGTANLARAIPSLLEHVQRHDQLTTPRGLKQKSRATLLAQQCDLIREIAPFPPGAYRRASAAFKPHLILHDGQFLEVAETPRTVALAILNEQAFDRLPVLADALEDFGFNDAGILAHLRRKSGHLRGCWALDLVLGRM
jgi:hypothetical protein